MTPLIISMITVSFGFLSIFSGLVYFFLLRAYRLGRSVDRLVWDIKSHHERLDSLEKFNQKSGYAIRSSERTRSTPEGMDF